MKRDLGVHPFLFALHTILSLYASQPGWLSLDDLPGPTAVVLILTGIIFAIATVFAGRSKAAILSSTVVMCVLIFTPIVRSVSGWVGPSLAENMGIFLLLWLTWPVAVIAFILRSKTDWAPINSILNVVAAVLVLVTSSQIAFAEVRLRTVEDVFPRDPAVRSVDAAESPDPLQQPDIYYLIFDRYAASTTLAQEYGFDNEPFLDYLRDSGFYIATEARSNYLKTAHSLSSSLNMEHIDYLQELYGADSENGRPLARRLKDHNVSRYLKARGYEFFHIGSWWEETRFNPNADENLSPDQWSEFSRTIVRLSFLPYVAPHLKWKLFDEVAMNCDRVRLQHESLMDSVVRDGPKFVFAHILLPHPPLVFDKEGECLGFREVSTRDPFEGYVSQVQFTNQLIEEFVEHVRTTSPRDPVIIIQADEGPFPPEVDEVEFDWRGATRAQLQQKVRILSAYHLPEVDMDAVLYPEISPVNTFRVLFNLYFGEEFDLLPDKTYAHADQWHPYSFFEVTDQVRY